MTQTSLPDAKPARGSQCYERVSSSDSSTEFMAHQTKAPCRRFMAAREKEAAGKLSLTILILTAGHVLVFGYVLMTGMEGFSQAGPPLIVNFILTVLVFVFWRE